MLQLSAHAKFNLLLDVLGKRSDGYHEVAMVMTQLQLHDRLFLSEARRGLSLVIEHPWLRPHENNLVLQAARLLQEATGCRRGARLRVVKRIPVAAGLGGGSADAAAALRGLNRLWRLGLSTDELLELGAQLGSDVPFCLLGGTALATGRGEQVEPLPPAPELKLVLATPRVRWPGPKTATVYRHFQGQAERLPLTALCRALEQGDRDGVVANMGNALAPTVFSLQPQVAALAVALAEAGAERVLLAGAGPTVAAIYQGDVAPLQWAARPFTDQVIVTRVRKVASRGR